MPLATHMTETSLMAYEALRPLLQERERNILNVFLSRPYLNLTNMEIAATMGWSINRVTGRVKSLRDRGVLVKSEQRPCGVTRNTANAWELNPEWRPDPPRLL